MKKTLLIGIILFIFTAGLANASSRVTFEWDANTESDLAGYRLYMSTVSGEYTSEAILDISAPDVTGQITVDTDGTYYFVLTAYDTNDNESGYSNEVSATLDSTPPGNPKQLKITIIINIP